MKTKYDIQRVKTNPANFTDRNLGLSLLFQELETVTGKSTRSLVTFYNPDNFKMNFYLQRNSIATLNHLPILLKDRLFSSHTTVMNYLKKNIVYSNEEGFKSDYYEYASVPSILSINIVNTEFYNGKSLRYNNSLLSTISKVLSNPTFSSALSINIYLNGENSCQDKKDIMEHLDFKIKFTTADGLNYSSENGVLLNFVENKSDVVRLGRARSLLESARPSVFYLNVDEDDDFFIESLKDIYNSLDQLSLDAPTLIGYVWRYMKNGETTIKVNPFLEATELRMTSTDDFDYYGKRIPINSGKGLSSWNLINPTSTYKFRGIKRPDMNKYDDCIFYSRLAAEFAYSGVDFLDTVFYIYNHFNAVMSTTNKVTDFDHAMQELVKGSNPLSVVSLIPCKNLPFTRTSTDMIKARLYSKSKECDKTSEVERVKALGLQTTPELPKECKCGSNDLRLRTIGTSDLYGCGYEIETEFEVICNSCGEVLGEIDQHGTFIKTIK